MRASTRDIFIWAALQLATVRAQGDPENDPPTRNFVRRADNDIALLGDYIYVVGGGVSRRPQDADDDTKATVKFMDASLALSIKTDWKPEDVQYTQTNTKDTFPDGVMGHALWADEDNDELLLWGGMSQSKTETPRRQLWRFKADGKGGGNWSGEDIDDDITMQTKGASTTCGGSGWTAGGLANNRTDEHFGLENAAIPGLMEYNFEQKEWTNHTGSGLGDRGTHAKGSAQCVEVPDRDPMLMILGGAQPILTDAKDSNADLWDFTRVSMWGIEQGKWFEQETYGERPKPRMAACTSGAAGPNGTFEIFMYGGYQDGGGTLDEIWILSLPAFRWFKAPTETPRGRYVHGCVRIGSQLISIGGNRGAAWQQKDGLANGVGVMDLNTMMWKDGFEAESDDYKGPQDVLDWYDERGYDTATWTDDTVRGFFLDKDGRPPGMSTSEGSGDEDKGGSDKEGKENNDSSTENESNDGKDSSSTPVGAIAGGVVGGVAGLALVGGLIWFLMRRRSQQYKKSKATELSTDAPGTAPGVEPYGYYSSKNGFDRKLISPHGELDGQDPHAAVAEMPGDNERKPVEMP